MGSRSESMHSRRTKRVDPLRGLWKYEGALASITGLTKELRILITCPLINLMLSKVSLITTTQILQQESISKSYKTDLKTKRLRGKPKGKNIGVRFKK